MNPTAKEIEEAKEYLTALKFNTYYKLMQDCKIKPPLFERDLVKMHKQALK